MVRTQTRADDEAALDILRRRDAGQRTAVIGRAFGKTPRAVLDLCTRIRKDDIAHDPEAAAYWHPNGDSP